MSQQTIKAPLLNPALYVTADHNLKQEEAPVLAPAKDEVLLHIKATGVCGYNLGSIPTIQYS
jgi:L-iditol 2-dehydrogenase